MLGLRIKPPIPSTDSLLTVLSFAYRKRGVYYWLCVCVCGVEKVLAYTSIHKGVVRSCGCFDLRSKRLRFRTHGMTDTPTWRSWDSMIKRCYCKTDDNYRNYGAKGISVCKRWLKFENFMVDMGLRPLGTTLDRKNNAGNYNKRNCRWATPKQQARNTSRSVFYCWKGFKLCLADWACATHTDRSNVRRYYLKGKLRTFLGRKLTIVKENGTARIERVSA